ncbi:hypothetical protein BDA96_07G099700 [Sorghum bicolor]|uniref:Uncharacterized protein n=1 Tax=Sorghum bicolor TaxID=4558 RepID=A0A921QMA9_SORBI|nr:hypothetical protein BDA96_07G099700 [Sorghum bicolor]
MPRTDSHPPMPSSLSLCRSHNSNPLTVPVAGARTPRPPLRGEAPRPSPRPSLHLTAARAPKPPPLAARKRCRTSTAPEPDAAAEETPGPDAAAEKPTHRRGGRAPARSRRGENPYRGALLIFPETGDPVFVFPWESSAAATTRGGGDDGGRRSRSRSTSTRTSASTPTPTPTPSSATRRPVYKQAATPSITPQSLPRLLSPTQSSRHRLLRRPNRESPPCQPLHQADTVTAFSCYYPFL